MGRPSAGKGDKSLREAMIDVTLTLIGTRGTQGFSMAEASRLAGVAQSAPYKHFANREALLAAVARRAYAELGPRLAAAVVDGDPLATLGRIAAAYVRFAADSPAMFAVLFSAGLNKADHPALQSESSIAYAPLSDAAASLVRGARDPSGPAGDVDAEATELGIATLAIAHGYAALMSDGQFGEVALVVADVAERASRAVMAAADRMARPPRATRTRAARA